MTRRPPRAPSNPACSILRCFLHANSGRRPVGKLLSREGRQYMEAAPHLAFWPGLALTVTVYSLNMLGDAVRDLLDPRLVGGAGRLGAHGARSV